MGWKVKMGLYLVITKMTALIIRDPPKSIANTAQKTNHSVIVVATFRYVLIR